MDARTLQQRAGSLTECYLPGDGWRRDETDVLAILRAVAAGEVCEVGNDDWGPAVQVDEHKPGDDVLVIGGGDGV